MSSPSLRAAVLAAMAALSACAATAPPPATQVSAARFGQAVVPGHTSKAELLAALGPTRRVAFDSGHEVWLYVEPAGSGRYLEFVVLIGPDGMVKKTRRRAP